MRRRRPAVAATAAVHTHRPYLKHGAMLSVGAAAWATSLVFFGGLNPEGDLGLIVA